MKLIIPYVENIHFVKQDGMVMEHGQVNSPF